MNTTPKNITKLLVLLTFSAITAASAYKKLTTSSTNSHKQQAWQKMEAEVASWTDALGMPIDEGIKKTIIALNLLGFPTRQSCEGHINTGGVHPWVSFEVQDDALAKLDKEYFDSLKSIRDQEDKIIQKYSDLSFNEAINKTRIEDPAAYQALIESYKHNNKSTLKKKIDTAWLLKKVPLRNLLLEFYKQQPINPDAMLIIDDNGKGNFALYSVGGDWQETRTPEEQRNHLKMYQQEMARFTDFLTDYYFNTPSAP